MAELPPPPDGIVLAHFIVSDDVERSRRFYTEVLGGRGAQVWAESPTGTPTRRHICASQYSQVLTSNNRHVRAVQVAPAAPEQGWSSRAIRYRPRWDVP